jgi:hypothetical protein
MTMRTLFKPFVAAVLVTVLGGPALAAARPQPPVAAERAAATQVAQQTRKAAADDTARYAARETKAQNLEQFKGGAALYIGGTALAVALVVVLLVLLI